MKATRWFAVLAGAFAVLGADAALAQIGPISYVTANSPLDSSDIKQITANCPQGKIAFNGGASISDGETLQLLLVQTLPQGNPPTGWFAVAHERVPTAANWRLSAHAVCAEVGGYALVDATSPADSSSQKLLGPACPPGKVPIGGGGGIFGSFSPDLSLFALAPTATGFDVSAQETAPFPGNWILHAKVSCAPADALRISAATDNASETRDVLELVCPLPRVMIGGGVRVTPGEAIYQSHPVSNFGWEVGGRKLSSDPWLLGGSALCLRPNLFADGFESGGTGAWSEAEPWAEGGVR